MNRTFRLTTLAACLALTLRLTGADTPAAQPAKAAPGAAVAAPAAAPAPHVVPLQLPRALEGFVTLEEYTTYVKFQQGLRDDPEIKATSLQIRAKMNEMLELQKKVQQAQQKAIEANPEIKAIYDKIVKSKPK